MLNEKMFETIEKMLETIEKVYIDQIMFETLKKS
jgi:hypothetical protein